MQALQLWIMLSLKHIQRLDFRSVAHARFLSLEEIDRDIIGCGNEGGENLLGAILGISEDLKKPKHKKKKKSGKEVVNVKKIDPSKHSEGFPSTSQQDEADIVSDVSTQGPSPQFVPSIVNLKKNKKKSKERKSTAMKDAMALLSKIKAANTLEGSPKLGLTQTMKKGEKGESKALFVVDLVISTVVGDNEGTTSKYARAST